MCCRDCLVQPSGGILPRSSYRVSSIFAPIEFAGSWGHMLPRSADPAVDGT
jgi:hypothetical protein